MDRENLLEVIAKIENYRFSYHRLHLDRSTWAQLAGLFPPLRDPLVAELGPHANDKITDDDYLAMIRFSNGDAAPGMLKKSFLTLSIQPPTDVISNSGGERSATAP